MNEEIKIIIKAVTDGAKKGINGVKKELEEVNKSAKGVGGKISGAFKVAAKGAAVAVAAVVAVGAALVKLGKSALEFNKEQAKLNTAFQSMGMSAQQASKTYNELYRYLGDSSKATEAAGHLAKITQNEKELAEWTKITQGIYATFGDSLPIEGLTEAANETIKVGKVTGSMADALNWAGVSEDAFNAKLAQTNSLEEREALTRQTLNELYSNAAEIYERNNKALLDYNESQARLDSTMGAAGQAILPLMTALNNLGSAFFTALKPALDAIIPPITTFVNWIAKAIEKTLAFFSALTGKSSSVKVIASAGAGAKQAASGLGAAAGGAGALAGGLDDTAKAAEEAKKSTQGFDELNIVSSGKSSSSGSSGAGGGGGSATGGGGGGAFSNDELKTEVVETEETTNSFAERVKQTFATLSESLKQTFAPSIDAWKTALDNVKGSWDEAKPHLINGTNEIQTGFSTFGEYLLNDWIPNVTNSFSTNLAPVLSDIFGFSLEEGAKAFSWFGEQVNTITNDMIVPAFDTIKGIFTDTFDIIGGAWEKHGEPLMSALSEAFENIRGHLDNFYNTVFKPIWDNVLSKFQEVWDSGLGPLVEEFADAFLEIGTDLTNLYNEFLAPIVDWLIETIGPIITDVVNSIIDIVGDFVIHISDALGGAIQTIKGIVEFITGIFTGDWEKAWEGIKDIFGGIWEIIKGLAGAAWDAIKLVFEPVGEFFKGCWDAIVDIFKDVGGWFKEIFKLAWEGIKHSWGSVGDWFKGIWDKIANIFGNVKQWFKDRFSDAWEGIKNIFGNWGSFFSGLWDKIKNTFSNLGGKLGDAIGGAVKKGINGVISLIEKTINKAIGLINGGINLINLIPGVNVKHINEISFPRLAKGGVVDSATFAMIGEQGKEAVVPLENNTEWMDKLADRLAARQNTPSKIVLMLDGRELGWATIHNLNGIQKQIGYLPLNY